MLHYSVHMKRPEEANPYTKSRFVIARGWGREEWRVTEFRVSFWGDDSVLQLDRGDGCTTL